MILYWVDPRQFSHGMIFDYGDLVGAVTNCDFPNFPKTLKWIALDQDVQKILIVDDEPNSTESLSIGLRRYGYHVETANDGKEGLSKIKNAKFDYVLCDIDMPEMNGWELASKIHAVCSEAKIIFMTAWLRGEVQKRFREFPLLLKPFKLNELLTLLEIQNKEVMLSKRI